MMRAVSAMKFRPADAACEYSHCTRSSVQFAGNTVQLTVAWFTGNVSASSC
jgi:hypothetical protein